MIDQYTKTQIEHIAFQLLKSSGALDKFPTPVDDVVNHAELLVRMDVNLAKVGTSWFSRLIDKDLPRILSNVRGFLDRKSKTIYLDLDQVYTRQSFVKLHETGHHLLPWQKEVLQYMDNDETLDPATHEAFEAEANYFATCVLFQLDRFNQQMKDLELGAPAAMHLAKTFGASNHAAFRRYVECSTKRCALLVLEKHELAGKQCLYKARDYFQSENFTATFGQIEWPERFGYEWAFAKDSYFRAKRKLNGKISLVTDAGEVEFDYHFFDNSYNSFVLLFPKGEAKKAKTKVVIKGSSSD